VARLAVSNRLPDQGGLGVQPPAKFEKASDFLPNFEKLSAKIFEVPW
jgi:hypothetical protein